MAFVGAGVEGGDDHLGAVVDADYGLALVVAEVEAVDVVAPQDDGLSVDWWGLIIDGSWEADHKFFEVDGSFTCFFGTGLNSLFAIALHHGEGNEG